MRNIIKKQILAIRDSGLTNMFDINTVRSIAYNEDFSELVCYLDNNREDYVHFILYGEQSDEIPP